MNENINRIYDEEKTVNLLSLCSYVLSKWKFMVIGALIMAIALGGLAYVKDFRAYQAALDSTMEVKEPEVSEYDRDAAIAKAEMIEEYKVCIEEYEYYYENSIKAKLNPNSIPQGKLTYLVSSESMQETLKAVELIETVLLSKDNLKLLSEKLSVSADEAMLREVAQVVTTYISDSVSEDTLSNKGGAKVDVIVQHYNENDCEIMLAFFEEQMGECLEIVDYAEVTKLSSRMENISDQELTLLSKDTMNGKLSALEAILKIEKDMTTDQKAYYEYLESMDEMATTEGTDVAQGKPSVNVLYVVVGAVAGAFCAAALCVVTYLFGGRVRSKEELEVSLPLPIFEMSESTDLLAALIVGIARQNGVKKICLTGSLSDEMDSAQLLKAALLKEDVELIVGNSILTDTKTLQEAVECGAVVFREKCNVTKEKDLRNEIVKADSCGIKMLGVILEK